MAHLERMVHLFFFPDRLLRLFLLVMEVIFHLLGSLSSWRTDNRNRSELYSFSCIFAGLHPSKCWWNGIIYSGYPNCELTF